MLRKSLIIISKAFSVGADVTSSILQLEKLMLLHEMAKEERKQNEKSKLTVEFLSELERLKVLLPPKRLLDIADPQLRSIAKSLRHFLRTSDPMYDAVTQILCSREMRVRQAHPSPINPERSRYPIWDQDEPQSEFQNELPLRPPSANSMLSSEANQREKFRGHWVLQDPDIRLGRADLPYEPW